MQYRGLPTRGQRVRLTRLPRELEDLPAGTVRASVGDLVSVSFPSSTLGPGCDTLRRREVMLAWADESGAHECPATAVDVRRECVVLRRRIAEQREVPRVRVDLPLRFEVLAEEDAEFRSSAGCADSTQWRSALEAARSLTDRGRLAVVREAECAREEQPWAEDLQGLRRDLRAVEDKLDRLLELFAAREGGAVGRIAHARVADLSVAGCRFTHDTALAPGTRLRVWIETERGGSAEVCATASVARCARVRQIGVTSYGIGVKFESMHAADRERICRLVARLEQLQLDDFHAALV